MDAASIEEINKLRKSMGMKPLPVPGQDNTQQAAAAEPEEDQGSTLETREAAAYDNYRKVQEAEQAKRKREEKAAAIRKAREKAQRHAVLEGKGLAELAESADLDAKSWLKNQKKRQKEIAKQRKEEEEKAAAEAEAAKKRQYTSQDLSGIKVGHDLSSFLDTEDQVLTLKDTDVLDEEEGDDVLENLDLREREKLDERLELKKKKPVYDPNQYWEEEGEERGILSHYDEDGGKKKKAFKLDVKGESADIADILNAPIVKRRGTQSVDIDMLGMLCSGWPSSRYGVLTNGTDDDAPRTQSDYLDISEIKVKKPKKKKARATRQRPADDDDALFPGEPSADQSMDVDTPPVTYTKKRKTVEEDFADDDDLQASLALQRKDVLKKRKKMRPADIAKQLRKEAASEEPEARGGGMVLDEITGFVDTLQKSNPEEDRKRASKPKQEEPPTAMDDTDDEDEKMEDSPEIKREESPDNAHELTTTGVDAEESVGQGMGATLKLLRDRGLLKESHGGELNDQFRQKEKFLAELHRRMLLFDDEARISRERDRASGRLDRMSAREREQWQQQQNTARERHQAQIMQQLYSSEYRPTIELKYIDEHGRKLDQKEAFKHLSHQFHGKGSGKGKTDKYLKKVEEEKRREAMSMLDASQNVGMSSAHAQQQKKKREAGVRLA
jgi:U4/U6.U5 tri-snRNP-associated protein 1